MMKWLQSLLIFVAWSVFIYLWGYNSGKIAIQRVELEKEVQIYQKRENTTQEQEKTAEKIKIIYRELKNDKKDCDFVLNFDVSKCLPK